MTEGRPVAYARLGTVHFDIPRHDDAMSAVIRASMNSIDNALVIDDTAAILGWLDGNDKVKPGALHGGALHGGALHGGADPGQAWQAERRSVVFATSGSAIRNRKPRGIITIFPGATFVSKS